MFTLFEKSPKIRSYKIFEKKLIFVNESFHIYINDTKISDNAIDNGYTYFSNNIIYLREMNTFIGYDKIENLSYVPYSEDKISNSIIFSGDFKLDYPHFTNSYYLYDFISSNKRFLFEYDNLLHFFRDKNQVFLTNKNQIHSYSLPKAKLLWQFNIEQLGTYLPLYEEEQKPFQVDNFLGVWQKQLLVACKGGLIISLQIEDGKLQKKWQELPKNTDAAMVEAFKGVLHQSGLAYQLNNAQDKIIALYYRHLIEIDLPTGVLKVTDLTQELLKHDISIFQHKSGYAEDDTHYYTTIALNEKKLGTSYIPTALCALNKETLAIDWHYRFDQDKANKGDYVSIQVPQVSGNKLYQLTANNVLHILKKKKKHLKKNSK